MSGPLPQYRKPTRPTGEIKGYKTVVDKVIPGRKGERDTYTFKDVPVFKHVVTERAPEPVSKHAKGKGRAQREHMLVLSIRKQVAKALEWMQANDKGWDAAVDMGLIPRQVAEKMGLLNG